MSLHYSNGQLSLQNISNLNWYYVGVSIGVDNKPHLNISQIPSTNFSTYNFDNYAIIRADDGNLYKLGIYTNFEGVITFSFEPATLPVTKQPVVIFIKDVTTGLIYKLSGKINAADGLIYPGLDVYNTQGNILINMPWRKPVVANRAPDVDKCVIGADFYTQSQVIVPPFIAPSTGGTILIGEGSQESILDENNKNIVGE